VPGILSSLYLGPSFGVIQNTVDAGQRATATAVLLFVVNLIVSLWKGKPVQSCSRPAVSAGVTVAYFPVGQSTPAVVQEEMGIRTIPA
jgi:hypothetical protein